MKLGMGSGIWGFNIPSGVFQAQAFAILELGGECLEAGDAVLDGGHGSYGGLSFDSKKDGEHT